MQIVVEYKISETFRAAHHLSYWNLTKYGETNVKFQSRLGELAGETVVRAAMVDGAQRPSVPRQCR